MFFFWIDVRISGELLDVVFVGGGLIFVKLYGWGLEIRVVFLLNILLRKIDLDRFVEYFGGLIRWFYCLIYFLIVGYSVLDVCCNMMIKVVLDEYLILKLYWICFSEIDV